MKELERMTGPGIKRRGMAMGSLRYWMIFQVGLGIWLIVSPFALGYRELTSMTLNDVILGVIVAILGLVVAFVGLPPMRHVEKKSVNPQDPPRQGGLKIVLHQTCQILPPEEKKLFKFLLYPQPQIPEAGRVSFLETRLGGKWEPSPARFRRRPSFLRLAPW